MYIAAVGNARAATLAGYLATANYPGEGMLEGIGKAACKDFIEEGDYGYRAIVS